MDITIIEVDHICKFRRESEFITLKNPYHAQRLVWYIIKTSQCLPQLEDIWYNSWRLFVNTSVDLLSFEPIPVYLIHFVESTPGYTGPPLLHALSEPQSQTCIKKYNKKWEIYLGILNLINMNTKSAVSTCLCIVFYCIVGTLSKLGRRRR